MSEDTREMHLSFLTFLGFDFLWQRLCNDFLTKERLFNGHLWILTLLFQFQLLGSLYLRVPGNSVGSNKCVNVFYSCSFFFDFTLFLYMFFLFFLLSGGGVSRVRSLKLNESWVQVLQLGSWLLTWITRQKFVVCSSLVVINIHIFQFGP